MDRGIKNKENRKITSQCGKVGSGDKVQSGDVGDTVEVQKWKGRQHGRMWQCGGRSMKTRKKDTNCVVRKRIKNKRK